MNQDATEGAEKVPEFSEKVTAILNEIGSSQSSELCRPDLDLTAHINKLFPTEQSLSQLDSVMANIEKEIAELDDELGDLVEVHGQAGVDGHNALLQAQTSIAELEQRIRLIKGKTHQSESSVHEMTKDIKQLDVAKRNLTASITTLHHLHLLLTGVNSLMLNVLQLFDDYDHVEQVRALTDKVQKLKENLSIQLSADLRHAFKTGQLNQNTTDMCRVAAVLGGAVQDEFRKWYITQQLAVYLVLYSESEDVAWIDKIEERYRWFVNKLAEFERTGTSKVFPPSWEMGRNLAKEFCILTRQALDKLMTRRKPEIDWKLLVHAINHTIMFETLLCKRFPAKEGFDFAKIIWTVFDKHMDVFLASQSKSLNQFVEDCSAKVRSGEEKPSKEVNMTAIPLPSSADLFLLLKKIITESSKLCANPDLILKDLVEVFRQCLRNYGHGCLSAFLPQVSSTSSSYAQGLIGTSSLLQNLMREETSIRLTAEQQFFTCCLLATADWCAETTMQLQDKLKQRMAEIDLNQEVELFYSISNNALTILVQDVDTACDASLQMMTKINWSNIEAVGDESPYVTSIRKHLKAAVPSIRDYFADRRKYFAHFCLKLASQLVNKFLGSLFRCKPISFTGTTVAGQNKKSKNGCVQLLLDTHALKSFLLNMPSIESSVVTKPPTMYTNTVTKGMTKAEMILKVVMSDVTNPEEFIAQYQKMLPDSDSNELQKVLEMRSMKRSDQTQLIQLYRVKVEGLSPSQSNTLAPTTTAASAMPSAFSAVVSVADGMLSDSGGLNTSMRRLEKLVKKKF
ncbi:vacuolar protein sorting-associated protein 53 like protein [Ditylenchus destructor]|uniref:Vacuolar protein sorting-associated protein 53 homolog n=1 Tax=Ditylenchus destructor TaxID=166010 RepID=A0AAD4N6R6_9BILA|nr:vacuolar protein sorting-associated protein 53 like protein [Ditylenchus destructor]